MAECTLVLIKPDAVRRKLAGDILGRFEAPRAWRSGRPGWSRLIVPLAERHYAEQRGEAVLRLEHVDSSPRRRRSRSCSRASRRDRRSCGRRWARRTRSTPRPGTIRGDLALAMPDNLVHGSDSPESAEREIALWFSDGRARRDGLTARRRTRPTLLATHDRRSGARCLEQLGHCRSTSARRSTGARATPALGRVELVRAHAQRDGALGRARHGRRAARLLGVDTGRSCSRGAVAASRLGTATSAEHAQLATAPATSRRDLGPRASLAPGCGGRALPTPRRRARVPRRLDSARPSPGLRRPPTSGSDRARPRTPSQADRRRHARASASSATCRRTVEARASSPAPRGAEATDVRVAPTTSACAPRPRRSDRRDTAAMRRALAPEDVRRTELWRSRERSGSRRRVRAALSCRGDLAPQAA